MGALVFQLPINNLSPEFISILAVCGMAAVSSSVIGAPVTSIILVLDSLGLGSSEDAHLYGDSGSVSNEESLSEIFI